ncbi:class I tRNA ligase family protein, partial [Litorivivens sp.]
VSRDYSERLTFNTAIAAVMELLNEIGKFEGNPAVTREALEACVVLLSPIVPHICHALWQDLGHSEAVIDAPWPQVDESALVKSSIEMVVQVNGKVRGKIQVAADADAESIKDIARSNENVLRFIDGKTIRKEIVVPQKLVNIVVG